MNHRNLLGALLALAVATVPAWSQTAFAPIASAVRAQALSLPALTPLIALYPADKVAPRQVYDLKRTFAPDGTFTVEWASSGVNTSQTFRPDGTLISSLQIDQRRGTGIEQTTDPARTSVRTVITEKGKIKSDKRADLKPGIALRDEQVYLVLQAWEHGIRDGLKFQSLSPDGGMVGDFQIQFVTTANPTKLSDKYTYPAEFVAALAKRNNYLVADMSLQGVGAFFYPHHFYLVYTLGPSGPQFVGYFGEDPKTPTFQYVP